MIMPQIKIIKISDNEYPESLKKIYDPPENIYVKGNIDVLNSRCIAIVGTRTATNYGKEIARNIPSRGAAA